MSTISFLSDFGLEDEFVGVCHAVIAEFAPDSRVIDINHQIPKHDVRAGSLSLLRAINYLPEGVGLAVVDPGVGTERKAVAIELENGFIVGPDNGLLAPAVSVAGGSKRVVELQNPDFQLQAPGPTFAARDILAPAAASLAKGVELIELGPLVDPGTLQPGLVPLPQNKNGLTHCEVLWVDRFGNCQINIGGDQLPDGTEALQFRWQTKELNLRLVDTYADLNDGELGLLTDSIGMLCLAIFKGSASEQLGLEAGGQMQFSPEIDLD